MSNHESLADVKIEPPAPTETSAAQPHKTDENPSHSGSRSAIWHFQSIYAISTADVETPAWNTKTDPFGAAQLSTTGVFTESRYSHSLEIPLQPRQSIRLGLSLVNAQSTAPSGWMTLLTGRSQTPDWKSWGLGGDIFLLRHSTANLDIDAGLQADYYISGVTTLPALETTANELPNISRLEQKMGWRIAFSGGIGGLYLGPLGLILRVSGQIIQAHFKGHEHPLRVQGLQVQLGADLALGRGEP